jgi:hypothetical protein
VGFSGLPPGLRLLALAVLLLSPVAVVLATGAAGELSAWVTVVFVFAVGAKIFSRSLPRSE